MSDLLALGAPRLPQGRFYRVRSDADGFVYVSIRRDVEPRWWAPWVTSRRVVEVIAPRTGNARKDIRRGCEKAVDAVDERLRNADYWDAVRVLEGDHR